MRWGLRAKERACVSHAMDTTSKMPCAAKFRLHLFCYFPFCCRPLTFCAASMCEVRVWRVTRKYAIRRRAHLWAVKMIAEDFVVNSGRSPCLLQGTGSCLASWTLSLTACSVGFHCLLFLTVVKAAVLSRILVNHAPKSPFRSNQGNH